ncbi:MAG: beta-propeller domain-containing protein [Blautia sp.]
MKDDGKLLEMLRKSAEDVEVPDGLKPDVIEKKLQEKGDQGTAKKKKIMGPWMYRACAAAAAVLLFIGGYSVLRQQNNASGVKGEKANAAMEADQTAEPEEAAADMAEGNGYEEEDAGGALGAAPKEQKADGDVSLGGYMTAAGSYFDIYQKLQEGYVYDCGAMESETVMEDAAGGVDQKTTASAASGEEETAVSDTADMELLKGGGEHSETNIQVEGVDEGDIVKTDGTYLYVLRNGSGVKIVRAKDLKLMSEISWKNADTQAYEMYLEGERLTVITRERQASLDFAVEDTLKVWVYDVSDPKMPKAQEGVTQDGEYLTSRKNGNYLYLFSRFYPQYGADEDQTDKYVPKVNGKLLDKECIYLPSQEGYGSVYSYLVITSMDLTNPKEVADSCAMVTDSGNFYVSRENIYATELYYANDSLSTVIVKFGYEKGNLTPVAGGIVPGQLLDSFSMDEYQGYLRVVSMSWESGHSASGLYVLDDKLETAGRIGDLAPGEQLKSARFMGDEGYFVTFLETDPLFSVDLSDPRNPKIIGELKIPGFSSYLHFLGEDQLLGIGWENEEETGWREVKLSMFDISDPSDVKESDKMVLSKAVECPAGSNYKCVLADKDGRFGFAYGCVNKQYEWSGEAYYYAVYRYEEGQGFVEELKCHLNQEEGFGSSYLDDVRGVTIGNTLYLVMDRGVSAFDLDGGERTGSVKW